MVTATRFPPEQYDRFRDLVLQVSGIEVPDSRRSDLEKAVLRSLQETGSRGTGDLYHLLRDPEAGRGPLEALVGMLTIGETHFFRNRPQFEALERQVLPDLIRRRRDTRRLRIWSAGCATGEEPYSLAILVKRLLPDLHDWHVTILATDIDRSALEQARTGVYRPWSFREVPEDIKAAWFTGRDGRFELHPAIRELVTFDYLNLVEDAYPSLHTNTHAMDLILCRNVLMYFRRDVGERVVDRLHGALSDDGWLVVGHTDPLQELFPQFDPRHLPGTVMYRKVEAGGTPVQDRAGPSTRSVLATGREPVIQPPPPRTAPGSRRPPSGPAGVSGQARVRAEATALLERGDIEGGRRLLQQIVAADPNDPDTPYLLAKIAANRLELHVADRWIDLALRRSPLHAPTHYLRGLLHQEDDRLGPALDSYRRCVFADPTFALGHFALAGVFARLHQPRRARKSLQNVIGLLANRGRDELLPDGDGMTIGRLLELVAVHLDFIERDLGDRP